MSLILYNGDCLEVMKGLPDASVDLILCDLPFGCLTGGGGKEKAKRIEAGSEGILADCSWDVKIDLDAFWQQVRRIRRSNHTPCIHFCTTKFGFDLWESNKAEFRYDLVWDKQRGISFLSANKMPMRSHEMIYVFSKAGAQYERIDIKGEFKAWVGSHSSSTVYNLTKPDTEGYKKGEGAGKRCVLSVINEIKTTRRGGHPTEKPVDLYTWLIARYCPAGGTVLDPTFGSCNSGRAAQALDRNYIGIEKDSIFFDKAAKNLGAE